MLTWVWYHCMYVVWALRAPGEKSWGTCISLIIYPWVSGCISNLLISLLCFILIVNHIPYHHKCFSFLGLKHSPKVSHSRRQSCQSFAKPCRVRVFPSRALTPVTPCGSWAQPGDHRAMGSIPDNSCVHHPDQHDKTLRQLISALRWTVCHAECWSG